MTSLEYRQLADALRKKAATGVLQLTHNGKTVRYDTVKNMMDAADAYDGRGDQLDGINRTFVGPTRLLFRRG